VIFFVVEQAVHPAGFHMPKNRKEGDSSPEVPARPGSLPGGSGNRRKSQDGGV
jgi:hypothetical protein